MEQMEMEVEQLSSVEHNMDHGLDDPEEEVIPASTPSSSSWFQVLSSKIQNPLILFKRNNSNHHNTNTNDSTRAPLLLLTGGDTTSNTGTSTTRTSEESSLSEDTSEQQQQQQPRQLSSSLAQSPLTPTWMACLLPFCCVATHLLFLYGQFAPMWQLSLLGDMDVWANASSTTTKATFDALGLHHQLHFQLQEEQNVETFTYMYAIRQLWNAKGLDSLVGPRLAAVLLIFFSGIWPHLKLVLLNMTWLSRKMDPQRRTRTLQWLGVLGKWSLADVLTVCVMVGVLHLEWIVDPSQIKQGLVDQLPLVVGVLKETYSSNQVCTYLLKIKTDCNRDKNLKHMAKCRACKSVVGTAYSHPGWAKSTGKSLLGGVKTNGGGNAELVVKGMTGIYAFCGAVILSVVLSFLVDVLDHRVSSKEQQEESSSSSLEEEEEHTLQFSVHEPQQLQQDEDVNHTTLNLFEDPESEMPSLAMTSPASEKPLQQQQSGGVIQPMEVDDNMTTQSLLSQQQQPPNVTTSSWILQLLCMCIPKDITLGLILSSFSKLMVVLAVTLPTMERQVHGAIPIVLHDILNVTWKKNYSLTSLMETTGKAGGWDYLLMSTFSLFCVFGPLLRAILCIVRRALLSSRRNGGTAGQSQPSPIDPKHSETMIKTVSTMINFMGSFCAWEVFVVAILMVQMLMPSITSTILRKPQCSLIEGSEGSCLEVEFNILDFNFWCFIVGGGVLLWMESSSSRTTAFRTTTSRQPHRPLSYSNHSEQEDDNTNIHHPYIQLEGNDTNEEDIENNVPQTDQ